MIKIIVQSADAPEKEDFNELKKCDPIFVMLNVRCSAMNPSVMG